MPITFGQLVHRIHSGIFKATERRATLGYIVDYKQDAFRVTQGTIKGQGDAHIDAVCCTTPTTSPANTEPSGLDNAGKTTIVKRLLGEDVNTVSPTLGFIIKTIDFEG